MTNIQFPSGLIDENIELFSHADHPMGLHAGKVKDLFDLPAELLRELYADLDANPAAVLALELSGFTTPEEKLKKYTCCRFGGFDNHPDYVDGKLSAAEYHECGHRGSCPMEGIVCASPRIKGRVLSPFETELVKLLASEDIIAVMAEKMGVSVNTFEERKKVLFEKFKVQTRTGLVAEAFRLQILSSGIPAVG